MVVLAESIHRLFIFHITSESSIILRNYDIYPGNYGHLQGIYPIIVSYYRYHPYKDQPIVRLSYSLPTLNPARLSSWGK